LYIFDEFQISALQQKTTITKNPEILAYTFPNETWLKLLSFPVTQKHSIKDLVKFEIT
jgi:hypothetical protein